MKKLLLMCFICLIGRIGFAQNQDKNKCDTIYGTATITILPPSEAKFGEIFCYCIEYTDKFKDLRNKENWKYYYVLPVVNLKGKYVETTCVLTDIVPGKSYRCRIYAYYWGYNGEYALAYWPSIFIPKNERSISLTFECMPTKIIPWTTTQ